MITVLVIALVVTAFILVIRNLHKERGKWKLVTLKHNDYDQWEAVVERSGYQAYGGSNTADEAVFAAKMQWARNKKAAQAEKRLWKMYGKAPVDERT